MRCTQLQSEVEAFERDIWAPSQVDSVPVFAEGQHGCLLCKVAFQTKQAWAAHAVRAHAFRSRQTVVAKGTQCQACMRKFGSRFKLIKHLQTMQKCLEHLEFLHRSGRLFSLTGETGHVQAPPDATLARSVEDVPPVARCPELLQALCEQQPTAPEQVLGLACQYVAPFEDLMSTLVGAADCLESADARAAVQATLPQFRVDLLCDKGQVLKQVRDALGFTPCIVPFPPVRRPLGFLLIGDGDVCKGALDMDTPVLQHVELEELHYLQIPVDWGLVAALPRPPMSCVPFWCLTPSTLRMARKHVQWCQQLLHAMSAFARAARRGLPAAIIVAQASAACLGCIGERFRDSGAVLHSSSSFLVLRFT